MRVGQGLDVHRFSDDPTRPLWLGLVALPDHVGLVGHSDADVVTHAIIDALLGAALLGDIGTHFPDNDEQWSGVASQHLLEATLRLVHNAGYRVTSVDVTIVAEQPKIAPYREKMVFALSEVVGCPVSVKATTAEGLGPIGRVEGMAALAICLIEEN